MKLAILGGGGVRIPLFVRGVLSRPGTSFREICLFEPDQARRETIGRLAVEVASALGHRHVVRVTPDVEEAFTGADFVFSAIRVGGDRGRLIDEEVALRRGLVGQETTGPGGCAMALRTIPVVLSYCEALARYAPGAVLINFTNPAGLITQAISLHATVRAVGVCDTPSGALDRLATFLDADTGEVAFSYGGLNHLGWISSFRVAGRECIGTLLERYEELQRFDHRFAAFDPDFVRRLGAMPTEYDYYYYEPQRYVAAVAQAGASRGADVLRLNSGLLGDIAKAFEAGDVDDAWYAYTTQMRIRRASYMRTDMAGEAMPIAASADGQAAASGDDAAGHDPGDHLGPARRGGPPRRLRGGRAGGDRRPDRPQAGLGDRQHPQRRQPALPRPGRCRGGAGAHRRRWRRPAGRRHLAAVSQGPGHAGQGVRTRSCQRRGNRRCGAGGSRPGPAPAGARRHRREGDDE